jgi:hypothetical protein
VLGRDSEVSQVNLNIFAVYFNIWDVFWPGIAYFLAPMLQGTGCGCALLENLFEKNDRCLGALCLKTSSKEFEIN